MLSLFLPTCVGFTGGVGAARDFSRRHGIGDCPPCGSSRVSRCVGTGFPGPSPRAFTGTSRTRSRILPVVPSVVARARAGTECLPVVHRLRLAASPFSSRLTWGISLARKPCRGFRRSGFSPLSLLMPASSLPCRPPGSRLRLRPAWKALTNQIGDSAASAPCLSPAHCRRAPLDQ